VSLAQPTPGRNGEIDVQVNSRRANTPIRVKLKIAVWVRRTSSPRVRNFDRFFCGKLTFSETQLFPFPPLSSSLHSGCTDRQQRAKYGNILSHARGCFRVVFLYSVGPKGRPESCLLTEFKVKRILSDA